MAKSLFSRPRSPPTVEKLRNSELAKIWSSASYYLSRQLALHQAVNIPGLGTFTVVRERVASQQKDLVAVDRPVFLLAKALAQDHDLQYDSIDVAGHDPFQQLPYAQIASENGISEGAAQLCVERTVCLFSACIDKRRNVAFVWRDVGMLLIEGKRVQMKFYEDFLGKLNGTADMLQALLGMPEMSKSVISRNDCAASQTTSGRVTVFPMYKHECVLKMTETAKVDLKYHLKTRHEQGWARPGDRGRKGDLCETRLLHRAALSPERLPALTVMPGRQQKAEEKEPRTSQLPAIPRRALQEKDEQEKVIPLVTPRMVDFVAAEVEKRMVALQKKSVQSKKGKEEKGKKVRKEKEEKGKKARKEKEEKGKAVKQEKAVKQKAVKQEKAVKQVKAVKKEKAVKQEKGKKVKLEEKNKFPKHVQKFLAEEEKKNKMLQKERKKQTKQQEVEVKEAEAEPEEVEMPAAQESSAPEEEYFSSLSESETEESSSSPSPSPSLMERMMGEREEAEEEPLSIFWDGAAFPRRRLSPRTDEALREVVQHIVGQVAREQQGQRDAERDLRDRLQSELAVLRWSRQATEAPSIFHLPGAGHKPAPPAGPRPGRAARVRRVVPVHVNEDHERSASTETPKRDIQSVSSNSSTSTTVHSWRH